ncbi:MAG: hypothetical protein AAGK04_13585, partial [Planctomycetota bacterium]
GLAGTVATPNDTTRDRLRQRAESLGGWPDGLAIAVGQTDAVLRWADAAVVASGTVTLQVARHGTPMVIFYKSDSRFLYSVLSPILFETEFFTLPNLIARREIAPEFVPLFGGGAPVVAAARALVSDPSAAEEQRAQLAEIVGAFEGRSADALAADAIEEIAGIAASAPKATLAAG